MSSGTMETAPEVMMQSPTCLTTGLPCEPASGLGTAAPQQERSSACGALGPCYTYILSHLHRQSGLEVAWRRH